LDTGNAALHLALFYLQKSAMAKKYGRKAQAKPSPRKRRKAMGRKEKTARRPGNQGGRGGIFSKETEEAFR
jgi:hypothetical protein